MDRAAASLSILVSSGMFDLKVIFKVSPLPMETII
jgi:hypothetical protein